MTMRIAHVGLRNLRSYRSADLRLEPGTTLLSGDIGSGKTSLLYAVEMALFGFAEVDPGYLVRHGARDAEVSLTLTNGTQRWELRRRFVRKARKGKDTFEPTENSLAVDGHRATYSATELRRRTIELLGFPDNPNPRAHSDVWRWAVYLAQERMRDVLDPDVDARMETVRKALGVEQYRLAGENAHGISRALQERSENLREQAARHRGVEDEAAGWKRQVETAHQELTTLEVRERGLRDEVDRARHSVDELEALRRESAAALEAVAHQERLIQEIDRSLEQDRTARALAQEQLGRLKAEQLRESEAYSRTQDPAQTTGPLRNRREELAARLARLEVLQGQATVVAEQLSQWDQRDQELSRRREETGLELARVQTELNRVNTTAPVDEPQAPDTRTPAELASERERIESTLRDLDRRLAAAGVELAELAEIMREGVCPRCHRPVQASEFEAHEHEQETLVSGLQKELERVTQSFQVAERRAQVQVEYDRLHDRWRELEARRSEFRQREEGLHRRAEEELGLKGQLDGEKNALKARRATLLQQLTSYAGLQSELAAADKELIAVEEQARRRAALQERITALENRIPEVQAEIDLRNRSESDRLERRAEVQREVTAARGRVTAPADLEDRWTKARMHLETLGDSLEKLLRQASEPRGKLAEATARLDDLARRQRERESLDQQSSDLSRLADWIETEFRNAMIDLERRRLQQGRLQFERRFGQYFAALVEDPSMNARVDDTFAPWVDIAGQPTPAEALSGGERTALALAFRLALGRTVRDAGRLALDTLILDEPTEGFSQEQTLRMGDLIESLGLPQVILVSHERQLEGIADRVVRVRKKDGVSQIEELDQTTGVTEEPPSPLEAPRAPAAAPPRRRRIRRLSDLEETGSSANAFQAK